MLAANCPREMLEQLLLPRNRFRPLPTIDDRQAWEALPTSVRRAHLARGEAALGAPWPSLTATQFLEFARNGNRSRFEREYTQRRDRLCDLVVAECAEAQGRFLDEIVNGLWLTCEETYWGLPACLYMQRAGYGLPDVEEPTVDLFAGETAGLLSWTVYLLGDRLDAVSPLVRPRVTHEIERRVLTPCLEREDFWWMGFQGQAVNNWNPWVNSNWLTSVLLLEDDPRRRVAAVAKSLRSLDVFIESYPADGGCDEGPSYWTRAAASLFDCLELLHAATDGAIDVYDRPLVRRMGQYIYRVLISDDYYVNVADAPAIVRPDAALVYRYGRRIGDEAMMGFGAWLARRARLWEEGLPGPLPRLVPALFTLEELASTEPVQPFPRDVWFEGTQLMVARDLDGSAAGLYLAAKGGHNAESHNHNDVGQLIVYRDGRPVLVDAGVETYRAETFDERRYTIWTMQSRYHNVPLVNGVTQAPGRGYAARDVSYAADDVSARLTLDLAGAYPDEAGLIGWRRSVTLVRGERVEIVDAYQGREALETVELALLTPCRVAVLAPGMLELAETPLADGRWSGAAQVRYDPDQLAVAIEVLPLEDQRLRSVWGESLTRVVLSVTQPGRQGTIRLEIV